MTDNILDPRIQAITTLLPDMTYEEQMEQIRDIRKGRTMAPERDRAKPVRAAAKKKNALQKLLESMTPEERAAFLASAQ